MPRWKRLCLIREYANRRWALACRNPNEVMAGKWRSLVHRIEAALALNLRANMIEVEAWRADYTRSRMFTDHTMILPFPGDPPTRRKRTPPQPYPLGFNENSNHGDGRVPVSYDRFGALL